MSVPLESFAGFDSLAIEGHTLNSELRPNLDPTGIVCMPLEKMHARWRKLCCNALEMKNFRCVH